MPSRRPPSRSRLKIPLQWVLVVPFALQTLGVVAVVGWLSYRNGQKAVESMAYHLLQDVSERISYCLDTALQTQPTTGVRNWQAVEQELRDRRYLNQLDFSGSGTTFIVERSGALVAMPGLEKYLQLKVRSQPQRLAVVNAPDERIRAIGQQLIKQFGSFRDFNTVTQLKVTIDRQQQFVQITPYQRHYGMDWLIITVVPESDFIDVTQRNLWLTGLLSFLTLLGTTATGFLTAFWIAKPIRQLSQASQALAEGRWQQSLEDSWITELSVLAGSFNRTADQLQQSFEQIKTALQESEEKFTKVFRTSPDPISIMTFEGGQYLEVNDSFLKFSEYSREEIIGRTPTELNLSVDLQQEAVLKEHLRQHGTLQNFEYYYRTKTGKLGTTLLSMERVELDGQPQILTIAKDISDRKHAEQALQQALQRIDSYFEHSPLAVMEWDQTGRVLRWSTQAEQIFGWSARKMKGRYWQECGLVYEEDRDRVLAELTPLRSGLTTSCIMQNRNHTKDGRLIVCQWYCSAVLDEMGNLVSGLSFAQDITDRTQIEATLRETEARNRAILHAIPDLITLYTAEGTYIAPIQRNMTYDAIADTNLVGKSISELLPPDIADLQLRATEHVLKTGEIQVFEQEIWVRGTLQYEEVRVVPFGEEAVLIIVRDISDRKRSEIERELAEEALRNSEEQIRQAFEDAAIGMAVVGLDGRFLRVSRSLCDIVGYREEELLARTFQDITHPDDLTTDLDYSEQMVSGELCTYQLEKRYIHKQGYIVWVLVNVSLVKDRNNQPLYFVSQIQDISDRHELDRIKNEFISIVSHELRTPLTAIRGALGILETGVLDNEPATAKQMLHVALNNSERLVRLVNDILDLERLESGKIQLAMELCEVTDLLMQAVESVQAIVTQAAISIEVTPLQAKILAAPDAIVQTLTNLIGNAIKFSNPGNTIWVTAEAWDGRKVEEKDGRGDGDDCQNSKFGAADSPEAKIHNSPTPQSAILNSQTLHPIPHTPSPTSYILFSIKDQGRGIPPEKLESIFGRFQQVDVSDSRDKGGTGLGLAICKSIVHQHGGKIWVESVLNRGSTFYFTLPQLSRAEA
ncbi:MAG: PAS domain S-box protein [Oscillatoriales cyanobacterium C42_A2020_001]|nr:PAS domain S-box protein [Leptolyngbyaceae cyanobacterium C42_A2020_001]